MFNKDKAYRTRVQMLREDSAAYVAPHDTEVSATLLAEAYADAEASWSWTEDSEHPVWFEAYRAIRDLKLGE